MSSATAKLQRQRGSAEISWQDGTISSLPFLWLRDNCGCSECRIEQTSERRFIVTSIAPDLQPESMMFEEEQLIVQWPGGHCSKYDESQLRASPRRLPDWTQWPAAFIPERVEYQKFLDDDSVAADAIERFLEFGALILSAAPTRPNRLEDLTPRLGPIRELLFDRIHDVQVDPAGYNVAHTDLPLPPHIDFPSYSWPPSVQALHMLANETPGGESVIVDGWAVLSDLREDSPELFSALCNTPVAFRQFDQNNETYAVKPLVVCGVAGDIEMLRFSNQLMEPLDTRLDGVEQFYGAYHELCRRITDDTAKRRFRLEGGEVLVVASHRVLHGREAFQATGRRHLQDAYFELDNIRNHLIVLARKGAGDD